MNLSELCLPFVRSLAFASRTTPTSNARRENAEATLLLGAADLSPSGLIEQLQTRIAGLTEEEVRERRAVHGRNVVAHERSTSWPTLLFNNLKIRLSRSSCCWERSRTPRTMRRARSSSR